MSVDASFSRPLHPSPNFSRLRLRLRLLNSMDVLAVTIFVSLALAVLFVVAFFVEAGRRSRRGSIEQDALLPFDDPPDPCKPPASPIPSAATRREPRGPLIRADRDRPHSSPGAPRRSP